MWRLSLSNVNGSLTLINLIRLRDARQMRQGKSVRLFKINSKDFVSNILLKNRFLKISQISHRFNVHLMIEVNNLAKQTKENKRESLGILNIKKIIFSTVINARYFRIANDVGFALLFSYISFQTFRRISHHKKMLCSVCSDMNPDFL